ncbi:exodeoxyribonuclease I [Motiliproteus sp. MSK22-1]|uniref:exodeoxyribonuclease I n=1 Tax=Motiliproteus sp. MSK22-1 TaxID=1897630 RepID=UPI00097804AD|nr:exodeoxyribonuclease I [Motiliproteus sp. MSK22-1]OMH38188.1 exodeoxyribonuclease I [Motiliproteus sp. MSK22-1]
MSKPPKTFYWHDYETFGANPMVDRPVQFAGIRTDEELNIIGEPLVVFCKPADDFLPHPEACLITGITPQQALSEGVPEAHFSALIHEQLAQPGTCGVGYNSIRFDDEITRFTFYRNFIDAYGREWQNGNSRWDIIDVLRLARALRPEGINWPVHEDGRPSLRLEDLTVANGIEHGNAHDALSDVYATIAVAKLLKTKQPKLYHYALQLRDKRKVADMLDVHGHKPVLHISSKYPAELGNAAVVAPLATHPINKNGVIVYDLRIDPTPLLELDADSIRQRLYTPVSELAEGEVRIPLKVVHVNRSPIIAPASMLNAEEAERLQISGAQCRTHLAMLRGHPELKAKLQAVFSESGFEPSSDPDQMLYSGGFFGQTDKAAMEQIRTCPVDELANLDPCFQDGRLEEMFFRYRARNYLETLSDEEQLRWEEFRRERLLGVCSSDSAETFRSEKTLGFEDFYKRLNELGLSADITEEKMHILQELATYAESIYPM